VSEDPETLSLKLTALRDAFDLSFAAPRAEATADAEALLAVRVAGRAYALRIGELAGLVPSRRIVPLPAPAPELIGLAGVRGGLVPVYSLGVLLGHGRDAERWLALCGGQDLLGLSFEEMEDRLQVPRSEQHASAAENTTPHVREVARWAGAVRPIVSVASILEVLGAGRR